MKKIAFLGDSITAGAGAEIEENRYTNLLCEKLKCECLNYGISGTRIAKQFEPSQEPIYDLDFIDRAKSIDRTADLVIVFGGTNDYGHGDADFGDIESVSQYTFFGAVKTLAEYLIDSFGREKIVFILPLHRFGEENTKGENGSQKKERPPLYKYREAIIEICNFYNLKYYSLNNFFPLPTVSTGDDLTIDGLHPNIKGHKLIADILFQKICNDKLL